MNSKNLIFDLEFTLMDYKNGIYTFLDAYKKTFQILGVQVSKEEIGRYISRYDLDTLISSKNILPKDYWG